MVLECIICLVPFHTASSLYQHSVQFHGKQKELKLKCKVDNCTAASTSFDSMRKHFRDSHALLVGQMQFHLQYEKNDDQARDQLLESQLNQQVIEKKIGRLLLDLESEHHLGAKGIKRVVEALKDISTYAIENSVTKIDTRKFNTAAKRASYYEKHLYYIKPKKIFMGFKHQIVKNRLKTVTFNGYITPLKKSIEMLMTLPEYKQYCVMTRDPRHDGVYDGVFLPPPHPTRRTLKIGASLDEVEMLNPLGMARGKFKQLVCNFEILNLPPEFRAPLQTKNAVFLCSAAHVRRFGLDNMLHDFVETIKESHLNPLKFDGIDFEFDIELVVTPCDTLANNYCWGFKETVSLAECPCRSCKIKRGHLCDSFDSRDYEMRTHEDHLEQLAVLESLPNGPTKVAFQRDTGIMRSSILATAIPNTDINKSVHDAMHVILEGGVMATEVQAFLRQIIKIDNLVTLPKLNCLLRNWNYHEIDAKNDPCLLKENMLDLSTKLNIKAASLYVLAQEIPFLVRQWVPPDNKYLMSFIRMLQITQLCNFAPECSDESVEELRLEVALHHRQFMSLYPDIKLTPKWHYLTHIVDQIATFGPPRGQSTMRWEANYKILKSIKLKNTKNPALTIATYRQKWTANQMVDAEGNSNPQFLNSQPTFEGLLPFDIPLISDDYLDKLDNYHPDRVCQKLHYGSLCYKKGVVLEITPTYVEKPKFLEIEQILLEDNVPLLCCKVYKSPNFVPRFCSYALRGFSHDIVPFSSLSCRLICPTRDLNFIKYVIRKHSGRIHNID